MKKLLTVCGILAGFIQLAVAGVSQDEKLLLNTDSNWKLDIKISRKEALMVPSGEDVFNGKVTLRDGAWLHQMEIPEYQDISKEMLERVLWRTSIGRVEETKNIIKFKITLERLSKNVPNASIKHTKIINTSLTKVRHERKTFTIDAPKSRSICQLLVMANEKFIVTLKLSKQN